MQIIKKFIAQILVKKNLKWVLIFLVVLWLFVWKSYAKAPAAATASSNMSTLDSVSFFLHLLLSLASWWWIILANLAGKLMTNDLVYGSFLHLDTSLWTLRNVMKNFANFALWFMVLYAIVRNVFSLWDSDAGDWKPIKIIKKTLIAGILIQMSWFLMWAVIDLSTIMTSAIGAMPSQFIASSTEFQWKLNQTIWNLKKWTVTFNPSNEQELVSWKPASTWSQNTSTDDYNKLLDTIMPSYDSVSGPLLFIGLSVFNFNDFSKYSDLSGWSESAITEWWDLILDLWLEFIVLVFFSLMMFLIFLLNLFRVILLWLIIPLLPMIILLKVFKLKPSWDSLSFLDIKNILMLVFKPVLMVWALSMILIVLVLIKSVINHSGDVYLTDNGNMSIETTNIWNQERPIYNSTIKSKWLMEFTITNAKDSIADIIVYFFGLFLIYFLVKMVATKGKTGMAFVDNAVEKSFTAFSSVMSSLPVVPIWKWVSLKAISDGAHIDNFTKHLWIDEVSQRQNMPEWLWWSPEMTKQQYVNNLVATSVNNNTNSASDLRNNVSSTVESWNKEHPTKRVSRWDIESAYESYKKNLEKNK